MDIRQQVERLLADAGAQHKRLIDYVVRQVEGGRHIAEVLDDPYVINRTQPLERRALIEEPEIIDAVGAEVLQDLHARLDALLDPAS